MFGYVFQLKDGHLFLLKESIALQKAPMVQQKATGNWIGDTFLNTWYSICLRQTYSLWTEIM